MAVTSRKRSAEGTPPEPSAQRPSSRRRIVTEPIDVETYRLGSQGEDELQISITLPAKFNVFPQELRLPLQHSYVTTVRKQLKAWEDNTTWVKRYTYSLILDQRICSSNPDSGYKTSTLKNDIPTLSLANTALLDHFSKNRSKYLKDPSFVPLRVKEPIANPHFIELHSVRHDEIGWGFDMNGCLSLYLVHMENGKLNKYIIFVQRKDVVVKQEV